MEKTKLRFTVRKSMIIVAATACLVWAWKFRDQNSTSAHSFTGLQIREYRSGDAARRRAAVENLTRVEPHELSQVLSTLESATQDQEVTIRAAAIRSLGSSLQGCVSSVNADAIPEYRRGIALLLQAFTDPAAEVRLEAAQEFTKLHDVLQKPAWGKTQPRLPLESFRFETAIDPLLGLMKDSDPRIRAVAVWAYSGFSPAPEQGPSVVTDLMVSDPNPNVRASSVRAFVRGWPRTVGIYTRLLKRLQEVSNVEERAAISWALGGLPTPPRDAIPPLIDALSLDSPILSTTIPQALAKAGPAARAALPKLVPLAQIELTSQPYSSLDAAMAIATIDPRSTEAQSLLRPLAHRLRKANDIFEKYQAALVLAKYGPFAFPALDSLREALTSGRPELQQCAARVLGSMGAKAEVALINLKLLANNDSNANVRQAATTAIGQINAAIAVAEQEPESR